MEDNIITQENIVKRKVKDTVFTSIFKHKKYILALYKALHPEDTEVTEEDLTNITLENILTDQLYNDLGFMVGNRLIILCEAQSTWSTNIIIRCAMYLMQTWQSYIESTKQNVYGSRRLNLPKPELYVIYTGEKAVKNVVRFSDVFMNGEESAVEITVNVISDAGRKDIIGEYIVFCKVVTEQVKLYGRTQRAIEETIRICEDRDVLKEYLNGMSKEVVTIMMALYDQEQVFTSFLESTYYEGEAKGETKSNLSAIKNLMKGLKMTAEQAMNAIGIPKSEHEKYLSMLG